METSNERWLQVAEIELVYRNKVRASDRPIVSRAQHGYEILLPGWENIDFIEHFKILLLNRANRVIGLIDISTGGTTGTVVDAKLIFAAAIKANACGIILAHNHPSGTKRPSNADISLTRKLVAIGDMLDISVLDHLILTSEGYYSFSEEGLL